MVGGVSSQPSRLDLRLLGPPRVLVDGDQASMDTRKATALLAYLAVTGTAWPRMHLVEMLWPEQDPDRSRAVFRRTLSSLRRALGGRWVEADRETVRFDGIDAVVDIHQALQLATVDHGHGIEAACPDCIHPLGQAESLFGGEFLSGFHLRDCPEFEAWQTTEAERWRRLHSSILGRLADAYVSAGLYQEAVDAGQRRVDLDPLHEPAHRRLMLLSAWAGDRSGAVEAYRACVRVLDTELGVPPLEVTTELYEAILDEDLPPHPAPPVARRSFVARPVTPFPLVGRDSELATLRAALDSGPGTVVVRGEQGVGKTRLLDALRTMAQGRTVVSAVAYRSEADLGFGVATRLLDSAIGAAGGPEQVLARLPEWAAAQAAMLVPELGRPRLEEDPLSGDVRLLDGVAITLLAATGPAPIIVVDDAHWLDHATTRLLAYLGRRRHRWPFLIALAYRAEDVHHRHPLADVVEESDFLVEPDRLSPGEIENLMEQMDTGSLDPKEVHRRTGGLPLLVTDALESGSLEDVSETVRRAVASRLEDVSSLATQLLTAAAVLDRPLDPDLLQAVSGREPDETADGVDELIRRGLLQAAEDRLDFGHDLIRDLAYQQSTPVRLRLLHRRAAEVLAKSPDEASAGMVARHLEMTGQHEAAAQAHRQAGDVARSVYASAEAVGHYQSALALGHPEVAAIRIALGELAMLAGDYPGAMDHFGAASVRGTPQEIALAEHRMGEVERRLGNWGSAERSFRAAEKDHPQAADLYADWALLQHRRGDLEGASRLAAASLQHAEEGDSPLLLARALNVTGVVETNPDKARAALEASLREAGDDPILRMAALNNLAALARRREESEEARHHLEEALRLAITVGDRHRQAAILDELAGALRDLNMIPESEERQRRAVELFADIEAASGERRPEIWLLSRW